MASFEQPGRADGLGVDVDRPAASGRSVPASSVVEALRGGADAEDEGIGGSPPVEPLMNFCTMVSRLRLPAAVSRHAPVCLVDDDPEATAAGSARVGDGLPERELALVAGLDEVGVSCRASGC